MKLTSQDKNIELLEKIFKEGFLIKDEINDFEYRHSQLLMALSFYQKIISKDKIIIEAGTGVGKSFAYLIPIGIALKEKIFENAVISTHTKTLQKQLFDKDVKILEKIVHGISIELAQGLENYICLLKIKEEDIFSKKLYTEIIFEFLEKTKDGDLSELEGKNISYGILKYRKEDCLKKECPYYMDCYIFKNIGKWKNADILITNHSFLLANSLVDFPYIKKDGILVIDEAQRIIEDAVNTYGIEININYLESILFKEIAEKKFIKNKRDLLEKTYREVKELKRKLEEFLGESEKRKIEGEIFEDLKIHERLLNLSEEVKIPKGEKGIYAKNFKEKLSLLSKNIERIIFSQNENYVKWATKEEEEIILKESPLNPGDYLKEFLYPNFPVILFTSATIKTGKDFFFFIKEAGIDEKIKTISLPSHFPYKKNVIIYIDKEAPSPKEEEKFIIYISKKIPELIEIFGGRALVLFTSYKMLKEVKKLLPKMKTPVLFQGEDSRRNLLKKFKEEKITSLFATGTFWEGIDVPGEALELLIIVRLPFDVPDEPYHEAKINLLKKENINPFLNYSLPLAILRFKQGFGRLIRKKTDIGCFAIFDSRILKSSYGKFFLSSLPPAPITYDIKDVRRFYENIKNI
ncbi:MAG: ATP-dependent DNA helicase [candidate division WOR-3 bacterium]